MGLARKAERDLAGLCLCCEADVMTDMEGVGRGRGGEGQWEGRGEGGSRLGDRSRGTERGGGQGMEGPLRERSDGKHGTDLWRVSPRRPQQPSWRRVCKATGMREQWKRIWGAKMGEVERMMV